MIFDASTGHHMLSFMDTYSCYNQIRMHAMDKEKSAFIINLGLYYYRVMPFRLKNARATYQRLVNNMFNEKIDRSMELYIDDLLVKSKEPTQYLRDLCEAFKLLKLNLKKCAFKVGSGKFLGFVVSKRGIEASPKKIKALLDMK